MRVVVGVELLAQLVGGGPEFGFQALAGAVFGFLGWSARHGVLFAFVMLYHETAGWREAYRCHGY